MWRIWRKIKKGIAETVFILLDLARYPFCSKEKRKYLYGVRRRCRYACRKTKQCWYNDNGAWRCKFVCVQKYDDICAHLTREEWETV